MEKLIYKYLQNELSEAELAELRAWLEKDSVNRVLFENIVGMIRIDDRDLTIAKKKILQKVMNIENPGRQVPYRKYVLWIAAILMISLGVTMMINRSMDRGKPGTITTVEALRGQKVRAYLPDGTSVRLNSGSKLRYPSGFSNQTREVLLEGEAYFDVIHDHSRPFRVITDKMEIEVLGTSFNVRSYQGDPASSVAVKAGLVSVSDMKGEKVILNPGYVATYDREFDQMEQQRWTSTVAVFGWTEQDLVFENLQFKGILNKLSRWYNVDFKLNKTIELEKRFTASYKDPSLRNVLESLAYAYEFDYEINANEVTIK